MKEIRIIGDEIYYDNTLVAKLVDSPMHTVQGEFKEVIEDLPDYDTDDDIDTDAILERIADIRDDLDRLEDLVNA